MFEMGTFAGIEDQETNMERKFVEEQHDDQICPVCGEPLDPYGGCSRCETMETTEIY